MRDKKSKNQKIHGKRRFEERYGIRYSQFIIDSIKHKIHTNQTRNIRKQSLRVSIYDLDIVIQEKDIIDSTKLKDGDIVTMRVVYDRIRKNIVSALPSNLGHNLKDRKEGKEHVAKDTETVPNQSPDEVGENRL